MTAKDDYAPTGSARLAFLVIIVVSLAAPPSASAGNEWFEVTPLPVPRAFHMTAFAATDSGPRLYAIGGQRSPSDTMEHLCIGYSPQSNSWSQRAAMSQRRGLGQACFARGRVWVLGGCREFGTGLNDVEVYNPSTNSWATGADMPAPLYDFGAAVWRDLVFIIGGGSWHPSLPPTAAVRLFDPLMGTWRDATSLPVPLGAMACGIVGDTLLVTTGWTSSGPTNRAWKGLLSPSNPTVISWQELDTLPGPRRCRSACGVANGELCVIGGLALNGSLSAGVHPSSLTLHPSGFTGLSDVWSLAANGRWTQRADKPHAVSSVCGSASSATGLVYVPGGYPGAAPYLTATEYLDMSSYTHDVGIAGIVSPAGRLTPAAPCMVSVTVRNFGTAEEDVDAHITVVDSITRIQVFGGDTVLSLPPDSSRLVEFGSFVPSGQTVFHAAASVRVTGDENPANDSARSRSRTTTGSDRDGYGYVYKTTQESDNLAFSWFNPTGGTIIDEWTPNGDEGTSRRNLPFQFNFYSTAVSRVYVTTNGYLQTSDNVASHNLPLPFKGITNIIAPFWDDLLIGDSGQVYENFTDDRAVYTWVGVRRAPPDTGRLTFQVILELDGDIFFNYLRITADATSSTVGIQGDDGSWNWYQEYVYNAEPLRHVPTDSTTILFDKPPLGVNDAQVAPALSAELAVPSICRGPVRITIGTEVRSLRVFSVTGSVVRTLVPASSPLPAHSSLVWNRRDQQGRPLPAGAYLLRAVTTQRSLTRKLVLLD